MSVVTKYLTYALIAHVRNPKSKKKKVTAVSEKQSRNLHKISGKKEEQN